MKRIITILVAVAIATSFYACSDDSVKMQREVGNFQGVSVSSGINLIISSSVKNVIVETASSKQEYVTTIVRGGVLHVGIKNNNSDLRKLRFKKDIRVYVPMQGYSQLSTSSGSSISTQQMMTTKDLTIKTTSGSSVDANVNCTNLSVETSSGSSVDLSGKCSKLNVETSSGSSFSSLEMEAQTAFCTSSSGSLIKVNVAKEITVKASSGSSIRYKGNGTIKSVNVSSGGSYKYIK